ncbi:MAG: tRNA pseudouridine synthase A [Proteobacteria bacterium]|nr:MAG: tRNA pseudouridine synthase A [Pseudomonadota bacterium]
MTRNIKLTVEYDGSRFFGFQRQEKLITVQGEIEKGLKTLTGLDHNLTVAGRTDKGVHATAQVCNFHTECKYELIAFLDGINKYLPDDVKVVKAEEVEESFNSRFSARSRSYEYYILNRRAPSAVHSKRITRVKDPLDVDKMQQAANDLVGYHDFSSFRTSVCQAKTPLTELYSIKLERIKFGDDLIIKASIHGRAFLHNMVRIIMGTLVEIGKGTEDVDFAKKALEAKDRTKAGPTLQPDGLFFVGVSYEDNGKLNHEVYDVQPVVKPDISDL